MKKVMVIIMAVVVMCGLVACTQQQSNDAMMNTTDNTTTNITVKTTLQRIDNARVYDDISIITNDGNIWIVDITDSMRDVESFIVVFDTMNTPSIYDDAIIAII